MVILIIILVIVMIAFGFSQGKEAKQKQIETNIIIDVAKSKYFTAKDKLDAQRIRTNEAIEKNGKIALEVLGNEIPHFTSAIKSLSKVSEDHIKHRISALPLEGLMSQSISLRKLDDVSQKAKSSIEMGLVGAGAGAVACLSLYGGAVAFGTASSGNAIALLSGAYQSKAALAWLGGGVLNAGGLGILGGQLVLGGVFVGTAIAAGGAFMNVEATKNLTEAKNLSIKVDKEVYNMKMLENFLLELSTISNFHTKVIREYADTYQSYEEEFKETIYKNIEIQRKSLINRIRYLFNKDIKADYRKVSEGDKLILDNAYTIITILNSLINIKILTDSGEINQESINSIVEAEKALPTWKQKEQ